MQGTFLERIKRRKTSKKKPAIKRSAPWLYPTNAERKYYKLLRSLTVKTKGLIKEILIPEIPVLLGEVKKTYPNHRNDDFLTQLAFLILVIQERLNKEINDTILEMYVIWDLINSFNRIQFEKVMISVIGYPIFYEEPWLNDQRELFASQNSQLIKSLPNQELERVANIVERGLQQGLRFTDVAKEIQKTFGISERRARLIARDQTSKLNSSLTMLRQQEIGITEFYWQTSNDERVRPTHRANEGKKFKWDKPSPITGHPGHDVNCRCVAIGIMDKIIGK